MTTSYKATVLVECWKEHECINCGSRYSYHLARNVTGTGMVPSAAHKAARSLAGRAFAREVDVEPCPVCGTYQPDMIGVVRARRHWYVFLAGLGGAAACLGLTLGEWLAYDLASLILVVLTALCLLSHLAAALHNPNRNLAKNLEVAQSRLRQGRLQVTYQGQRPANAPMPGTGLRLFGMLAALLILVGLAAMTSGELLRRLSGWPLNRGTMPPVAGPGDRVTFYFPKRHSIKRLWEGQAEAHAHDADDPGENKKRLACATEITFSRWGDTLFVKSSEKHPTFTPWMEVALPDDALAGKTLVLDLALTIKYPKAVGDHYVDMEEELKQTERFIVATRASKVSYLATWWVGSLAGLGLTLLGGLGFLRSAYQLRSEARLTRVIPIEEEQPEEDENPFNF